MLTEASHVKLTGNALVDTGIAAAAALSGYTDYDELATFTLVDCRKIHGDGENLARVNERRKSFTMFFTTNPLLKNPSIKPPRRRRTLYQSLVTALLEEIGNDSMPMRCEACGAPRSVDLTALYNKALGIPVAKQTEHNIGREWFPLVGSLGSDAQALPSASRAVHLCARCLFFVQYAPYASMLHDGRLAIFQSTSEAFWYDLVVRVVREAQKRAKGPSSGRIETLGKKEGLISLERHLLDLFKEMQRFDPNLELFIWRFTNSGPSPQCDLIRIPNDSLRFLYYLAKYGLANEALALGRRFYEDIVKQVDHYGLYPWKERQGASPRLYAMYQNKLMGWSARSLRTAYLLGQEIVHQYPDKTNKAMRHERLRDRQSVARLRSLILKMLDEGKFNPEDCFLVFPNDEGESKDGRDLVRYYMNHTEPEADPSAILDGSNDIEPYVPSDLRWYANTIRYDLVAALGEERFAKVLRRRMSPELLRAAWTRLACSHHGFEYADWQRLVGEHGGLWETLFKLSLLWRSRTHELTGSGVVDSSLVPITDSTKIIERSGLPTDFCILLSSGFASILERWGARRLKRHVDRAVRGETGLAWFRVVVVSSPRNVADVDGAFDNALRDEYGRSSIPEALFKMRLFLSNFYRQSMQLIPGEMP